MRNIVCIGGSFGALDAIQRVVRKLPADLPAAVFIVRHAALESAGLLAPILQPTSALPVGEALDGAPIQSGRIYIGPPGRHLLLERDKIKLAIGPKENWARPAIDPLFRTAAQFHGPRTIGIILSGKLDDGVAGLWALKRRGGFVVVQSPHDAIAREMPEHALAAVEVDAIANADEIGTSLLEWCQRPSGHSSARLLETSLEAENSYFSPETSRAAGRTAVEEIGIPSGLVCPDCGGQLWRAKEGPLRYRCHVGHAQSAHAFLAQQNQVIEEAEWTFIRALEDQCELCHQILQEKLSPAVRETVLARLAHDRRKLEQLWPLVFATSLKTSPATETNSQSENSESTSGESAQAS